MKYFWIIVPLLLLFIPANLKTSCPDEILVAGKNRIVIMPEKDGCFVITRTNHKKYKNFIHFRFNLLGDFILTLTPAFYFGSFKTNRENTIDEGKASLNAVILATFLINKEIQASLNKINDLDIEISKLKASMKVAPEKIETTINQELESFQSNVQKISKNLESLQKIEGSIQAFSRINKAARSLSSWTQLRRSTLPNLPNAVESYYEIFVN